jgi:hypothetical protein
LGHSFVHDLLYEVAGELMARGRIPLLTPHAAIRMVRELYLLLWKAFVDKQYHGHLFRLAYEGSLFAARSVLALMWAVLDLDRVLSRCSALASPSLRSIMNGSI